MGRPLRRQLPDQIYFVSNRTLQERFFLRPDPECNRLVGKWLAKSIHRFGVEVFGFLFMSNHYHMLVRAPRDNLHEFIGYLQGNLAKDLNALRNRSGPFWHRRYSAEPVLDEDALVDRLVYLLMNPVAADLVGSAALWPGQSSWIEQCEGGARSYKWTDRVAWRRAGCPVDRRPFQETHKLEISVLPHWRSLGIRKRRNLLRDLLKDRERTLSLERRREGRRLCIRSTLGIMPPERRPKSSKRSPRPLCHVTTREGLLSFKALWRDFVLAFREAASRLADGIRELGNACFPAGSFPPRLPRPWPATG